MPRNRDLFDDTTMTFGEHLEVLRVHVWKSLVGIALGIMLAMFVGDRIIGILKAPIDQALKDANIEGVRDDLGDKSLADYFKQWFSDDKTDSPPVEEKQPAIDPKPNTIQVEVTVDDLVQALHQAAPEVLASAARPSGSLFGSGKSRCHGTAVKRRSDLPQHPQLTIRKRYHHMIKYYSQRHGSRNANKKKSSYNKIELTIKFNLS